MSGPLKVVGGWVEASWPSSLLLAHWEVNTGSIPAFSGLEQGWPVSDLQGLNHLSELYCEALASLLLLSSLKALLSSGSNMGVSPRSYSSGENSCTCSSKNSFIYTFSHLRTWSSVHAGQVIDVWPLRWNGSRSSFFLRDMGLLLLTHSLFYSWCHLFFPPCFVWFASEEAHFFLFSQINRMASLK